MISTITMEHIVTYNHSNINFIKRKYDTIFLKLLWYFIYIYIDIDIFLKYK